MNVSEIIDRALEPFAPRLVRRRISERMAIDALRDYDIAQGSRRNPAWRRRGTSADAEGRKALNKTRDAAADLVRNNPYAAAIVENLTAQLVGDGIAPRAVHPVKSIQKKAQAELDAFYRSKVDGRRDMFGVQDLVVSAMIEAGEALIIWGPDDKGPDGRCQVLEGAYLDHLKNQDVAGENLIVQGVEFDTVGENATRRRVAYWLFDRHPGEGVGRGSWKSQRYAAENVDHVYVERRPGQTRGISWIAHVAPMLQDIAETFDAKLMKEKVAACLALVLTAADGGPPISPFDGDGSTGAGAGPGIDSSKPADTLRPGVVLRARAGETATVVNPPQSGEGVGLIKQGLMAVAATTVPYHVLTGDPSEANYSALRALTNPFHARLDRYQQHTILPLACDSTCERRMRRLALQTGDRRFLAVTFKHALPLRRTNDPIKDFAGELMEVRGGMKSMVKSLTERGLNPEDHAAEIAEWLALTDKLHLAFDTDPRRLTGAGMLQAAVGYINPNAPPPEGT